MNKIITYDNLRLFAYSNDALCDPEKICGIALSFFGLGGASMFWEDTPEGKFFAEHNIIYVVPYTNPWAWMNSQAVALADELTEVLIKHYDLPDDIPIASTGGSMGGLSALVYTRYAYRTPAVCVANCPVCDLPYHYTERPDLPRTLYSAFGAMDGDMEKVLESASPLHLANTMPNTAYVIFHCDADKAVNKEMHSDRFIEEMRKNSLNVIYYEVEGRGHCDLPDDMRAIYNQSIIEGLKGGLT